MSGASAGVSLRCSEEPVGEPSLKRTKGRAVNRVDDDWNTRLPGGDSPENAGFATVGMNDIRPGLDEHPAQSPHCQNVLPGMDRTDQLWDDRERLRHRCEFALQ